MRMSSYPATSGLGARPMQVLRSRYSDSLLEDLCDLRGQLYGPPVPILRSSLQIPSQRPQRFALDIFERTQHVPAESAGRTWVCHPRLGPGGRPGFVAGYGNVAA